jgi:hypothetical protein
MRDLEKMPVSTPREGASRPVPPAQPVPRPRGATADRPRLAAQMQTLLARTASRREARS